VPAGYRCTPPVALQAFVASTEVLASPPVIMPDRRRPATLLLMVVSVGFLVQATWLAGAVPALAPLSAAPQSIIQEPASQPAGNLPFKLLPPLTLLDIAPTAPAGEPQRRSPQVVLAALHWPTEPPPIWPMAPLSQPPTRIHYQAHTPDACLPPELKHVLDLVVEKYGDVQILSTHRDPKRNRRVGGARHSMHLQCRAVDFRVRGKAAGLAEFLRARPEVGGLKRYPLGFFHIDNGPTRAW
jgi:hypothetical protein